MRRILKPRMPEAAGRMLAKTSEEEFEMLREKVSLATAKVSTHA